MATTLLGLFLAGAALAPAAGAEFGQIGEPWGSFGTGNAQFSKPGTLGVDPVDGSVYGGDISADGNNFRVQKLSSTGTFQASVLISRILEPETAQPKQIQLHGIAVDHEKGRVYLIEGCKVTEGTSTPCKSIGGKFAALRVLIFNTTPTGTTLVPAATASLSLPSGADELYKAHSIQVDPTNHDLVILAEDAAGHLVVQRFNEDTGASIARFVDSTNVLDPAGSEKATGIAVAPDHATYTLLGGADQPGAQHTRAFKLPENLSSLSAVSGFAAAAEAENWTYGLTTYSSELFDGPQIAISPDGDTLYWKEVVGAASETEAGSYLIRGYSLSQNGTSVIYGGGNPGARCVVTTGSAGLATVGDRLVAFDFGWPTAEGAPPYGDRVLTFGPGGTGCPSQGASHSFKLTVTKEGSGGGTVGSSPIGVDCGADCEEEYKEGRVVTLTATAVAGSEFKGWTTASGSPGTCTAKTSPCQVTMGAAVGLKAKFDLEPGQVDLTINKSGDGDGSFECDTGSGFGACAASYLEGTTITIKALPDIHSSFGGWSGGGCSGTGNCVISNIAANTTVTGTYNQIQRTLTIGKTGNGNGSIQCNTGSGFGACAPTYPDGTTITIQATPNSHSSFAGWSGGGCSGVGTCVIASIAANTSVSGVFNLLQWTLTITKTGSGSGSLECDSGSGFGSCTSTYADGASVTIKANPDSNSTFGGWSGEGCSGTGTCEVTMTEARALAAAFNANPPPPPPPPPSPVVEPPQTGPSQAEILQQKRQKALKKCKKLKGKARAKCIKRAKAIGKSHKRSRR
jgi:hypothetical protein